MGWFDVAATPDGRSYAVAAYRTGTVRIGGVPGAVPAGGSLGGVQGMVIFGSLGRLVNTAFFRGGWTVRVAPWYGHRGQRRKVRVPTELESDRRAGALFHLNQTGQWDPELEVPPAPAPVV